MNTRWKADELVQAGSKNVGLYKHNFLQQVVCELRFPTLMELGETRPPSSFVKALRKSYPILELGNEVTVGVGPGGTGTNNVHTFRSVKMNWSVSLKQSAISIETSNYTGFANLRERVLDLVEAASDIIDSDFFTRIGLRYINLVNFQPDQISEWINPRLVGPIISDAFKGINDFGGKISLLADDGGCLLQHGIRFTQNKSEAEPVPKYIIDIDTYRTEISVSDTVNALDIMHQQAFDIFDWSLNDKARAFLLEPPKTRSGA